MALPKGTFPQHSLAARTTAHSVAEWLRQSILRGECQPGERLVELRLAKKVGVGQGTVREALLELEDHGLVQRMPNRGTFVTEFDTNDLRQLHQVRMALEVVVVEQAASLVTDAILEDLAEQVNRMERAGKRSDIPAFHEADMAFHRLLWKTAGNRHLAEALERVTFGLFAFFALHRHSTGRHEDERVIDVHREILKGLASRDPVIAAESFTEATDDLWHRFHLADEVEEPAASLTG